MGLNYYGACLVMFARAQGLPLNRLLTLGRLHCPITPAQADRLAQDHGVDLSASLTPGPSGDLFAEPVFAAMGVGKVESMDMSAYQGCSVCHDLNRPLPPTRPGGEEWGTWDAVFDGGTLEHVFHLPNALATVMKLIRVGGHFFATAPANAWLGHGFYQFSPELFYRVFSPANGFEMVRCFLAEYPGPGRIWQVRDPAQTGLRSPTPSSGPLLVLMVARKVAEIAPFREMPQQSDYQARWTGNGQVETTGAVPSGLASCYRYAGRCLPPVLRQLWQQLARRRRMRQVAAQSLTEVPCVQ